jgi:hypothetical protein
LIGAEAACASAGRAATAAAADPAEEEKGGAIRRIQEAAADKTIGEDRERGKGRATDCDAGDEPKDWADRMTANAVRAKIKAADEKKEEDGSLIW